MSVVYKNLEENIAGTEQYLNVNGVGRIISTLH